MMTHSVLRDIYNKIGHVTTKAEFEQNKGNIPQSIRYL